MDNLDNRFPPQLFPHFYMNGPPDVRSRHSYSGWGSYGHILQRYRQSDQDAADGETPWEFEPQHKVEGEMWIPTEPIVTPLLHPNKGGNFFSGPPFSPDDFPEHMQHFYVHHCMDSFSTMGRHFADHFNFGQKFSKDRINMGRMRNFVNGFKYKKYNVSHAQERVNRYHHLLEDVISDVPAVLLAELLHEELSLQRDLEQFHPGFTGGALGYVPLPDDRGQGEACLIYPQGEALDSLNFHHVVLEFSEGKPRVKTDHDPLVYSINGTVRQISAAEVDDEAHIGVRSDHFCASLVIKDGNRPRPVEVIELKERCTSINVSPHIPGELVVSSESGAAYLWIVGNGQRKIREEKSNLYFNAKSPWRWCEFSAHPRVMVYADRTGAELTDIRSSDCHTLFRIGRTAGCRSGERVILAKYLGQSHAYHHLITTQFSAYILDERMPSVPALKWEHMMESPPCFAHLVPARGSSSTPKILLGAQRGQETTLLQYSGGREQPCQSNGSVQKLWSPCESLKVRQIPHRQHLAQRRLDVPAAGLTATQGDDFLTVFQFTEAGDLFSQSLKLHLDSNSNPDPSAPSRNVDLVEESSRLDSTPGPQVSVEQDDSHDEDSAPEIPEHFSDSDFETEMRQRMLSQVEVVINDDQDGLQTSNAEEGTRGEPSSVLASSEPPARLDRPRLIRPENPQTASRELKIIWKKWLDFLLTEAVDKKQSLKHIQRRTKDIVRLKVQQRDKLEEDKVQRLRKDLKDALKNRKLLVHRETYLPSLKVPTIPDTVDPSDWPDDLSQRLSASWGDGWRNWWEEKLGLNKDRKIEALRRKRSQEKRAKGRKRMALSGSFTSSVSYQDDLSGWSSATSQFLGSDSDSLVHSQSAPEDEPVQRTREPEPETVPKSPVVQSVPRNQGTNRSLPEVEPVEPSLRTSPSRTQTLEQDRTSPISEKQNGLQGSSSRVELEFAFSPSKTLLKPSLHSQQKPRQQQQDYLSSLFGSPEPSQQPEEADEGPFPAVQSQQPSFPSVLRRSSQHRPSSQSSQPQRKKSRMGF